MRFTRFERASEAHLGVAAGDSLRDLTQLDPRWRDLPAWLAASDAERTAALRALARQPALPLAGQRLLTPLAHPGKVICLGLNYFDHAVEGRNRQPEYPAFFMRSATSLVAHGQPIVRPRCSLQLDYEAELAVVIGRTARHRTLANALDCVAGYACFNDATLRDYQRKTTQWTIGKNFDATGAFGPWMVSPDDLPPGAAGLRISSRLNGRVMQDASTSDMIWGVAEAIMLLTECLTLEPGDVIAMGTPAGVGYPRTPPVWMQPGDTVAVEIEGIGLLANAIVDES
jgi:acylpyruvate hydrolase